MVVTSIADVAFSTPPTFPSCWKSLAGWGFFLFQEGCMPGCYIFSSNVRTSKLITVANCGPLQPWNSVMVWVFWLHETFLKTDHIAFFSFLPACLSFLFSLLSFLSLPFPSYLFPSPFPSPSLFSFFFSSPPSLFQPVLQAAEDTAVL